MRPEDELSALMRQAYMPCSNIDVELGLCREAKWAPETGHIPRGFLGATGALEDVELVMVFAEPGHPHPDEIYDPEDYPDTCLITGCVMPTSRSRMVRTCFTAMFAGS